MLIRNNLNQLIDLSPFHLVQVIRKLQPEVLVLIGQRHDTGSDVILGFVLPDKEEQVIKEIYDGIVNRRNGVDLFELTYSPDSKIIDLVLLDGKESQEKEPQKSAPVEPSGKNGLLRFTNNFEPADLIKSFIGSVLDSVEFGGNLVALRFKERV